MSEIQGRRDAREDRSSGRSEDFRLVHFSNTDARPGDIVDIRITDASAHYLIGDLISVRKTRGGDAHEARVSERKIEPLLLGIPTRR